MVRFRKYVSKTLVKVSLLFLLTFLFVSTCQAEPKEWKIDLSKYLEAEELKADFDKHFPEFSEYQEIKASLIENGFELFFEKLGTGIKRELRSTDWKKDFEGKTNEDVLEVYTYYFFRKVIPEPQENNSIWLIFTRFDQDGKLESSQASLRFHDENFSARGRPFRFENLTLSSVEAALMDLMDQKPTPEKIDKILLQAGAKFISSYYVDPNTKFRCKDQNNPDCFLLLHYRYSESLENNLMVKLFLLDDSANWILLLLFDRKGKFVEFEAK